MRRIFWFIIFGFFTCQKEKPLIIVANKEITEEYLKNKIAIREAYLKNGHPEAKADTTWALLTLIQDFLTEIVAEKEGLKINKTMLEAEAQRFDRETRRPQTLARIKELYKGDTLKYYKFYVKPILTERLLQEKFYADTLYHLELYQRIKKAYEQIEKGLEIEDTMVQRFEPDMGMYRFYQRALNRGVVQDINRYYFVKKEGAGLVVFAVGKNNYTKWFEKKSLDYPVIICQPRFRQRILEYIRGNDFWERLFRVKR